MSACWNERALTRRQLSLVAMAALGFALGFVVYATDRGGQAQWLPEALAWTGIALFGAAGRWLPSLVHTFSFSLLAAAAWPIPSRMSYVACGVWWATNVVFEFAQLAPLNFAIASDIDGLFGSWWLPHAFSNYLVNGTFDFADIFAASAGAMAAVAVIHKVDQRRTAS